jgi:hypothetical protein
MLVCKTRFIMFIHKHQVNTHNILIYRPIHILWNLSFSTPNLNSVKIISLCGLSMDSSNWHVLNGVDISLLRTSLKWETLEICGGSHESVSSTHLVNCPAEHLSCCWWWQNYNCSLRPTSVERNPPPPIFASSW